ncbi:hypothetical protein [Candidatus Methylobacter oryzae]|uniref:Uncharacterized protein n=1 Tax=Candidatus Methylobacter oryzae TaxID=2497749 RepID=A0ABY3C4H6_9GAMM|nr:hypothetical protein [Candidatus Methylobacter oryzae]TRW89610.1 hypothetical protein EKO24_021355 [Candidatus Methylobacter oryzae]
MPVATTGAFREILPGHRRRSCLAYANEQIGPVRTFMNACPYPIHGLTRRQAVFPPWQPAAIKRWEQIGTANAIRFATASTNLPKKRASP